MAIISVIVPVYNAEQYLDRCVQSIVSQTFSDLEIILIDDGSKDNSGTLCDMWAKKDSRIHVIHQKNAGAGAARNRGLSIATGEYIGFVDSDNWIAPDMYQILYNAILKHVAEVAMGQMIIRKSYSKPSLTNKRYSIVEKNRREMLERFFRIHGEDASIIDIGPKLIKKSILENFKFIEGTICEDVFASFEFILRAPRTVVIDSVVYYYFINSMGVTRTRVSRKDFEYIDAYKRILDYTRINYPDFVRYANLNYLRAHFTVLSKMKLYGYDRTDSVLLSKKKELKRKIRDNFWTLFKWNMPLSRKVLLLLVCI